MSKKVNIPGRSNVEDSFSLKSSNQSIGPTGQKSGSKTSSKTISGKESTNQSKYDHAMAGQDDKPSSRASAKSMQVSKTPSQVPIMRETDEIIEYQYDSFSDFDGTRKRKRQRDRLFMIYFSSDEEQRAGDASPSVNAPDVQCEFSNIHEEEPQFERIVSA